MIDRNLTVEKNLKYQFQIRKLIKKNSIVGKKSFCKTYKEKRHEKNLHKNIQIRKKSENQVQQKLTCVHICRIHSKRVLSDSDEIHFRGD